MKPSYPAGSGIVKHGIADRVAREVANVVTNDVARRNTDGRNTDGRNTDDRNTGGFPRPGNAA
jgi:hypothetical protein